LNPKDDASLWLSWTQTNCFNPKGEDKPHSLYANTSIQFNRYVGDMKGPFVATCPKGQRIRQFDALVILKGTKDGSRHFYEIDCPLMHQKGIDYARLYPAKSGKWRTTCVCNNDKGGMYTSTFLENMEPFFYTDWRLSHPLFAPK
jgi:hypothetical protein